MLEELRGAHDGREVKPEEMPKWIKSLMYLETLSENFWIQNEDHLPVDDESDLDVYISIQSYIASINGSDDRLEDRRGRISGCMLERMCKKAKNDPVYINGQGQLFNKVFSSAYADRDIVIDDIDGDFIGTHLRYNMDRFVIANSEGSFMLFSPQFGKQLKTLTVANCITDKVLCGQTKIDTPNSLIIVNSDLENLPDYITSGKSHINLIAVNCRLHNTVLPPRTGAYDCLFLRDSESFTYDQFSEIRKLAFEMQGKTGLEIYALGKQIEQIVEGERRA